MTYDHLSTFNRDSAFRHCHCIECDRYYSPSDIELSLEHTHICAMCVTAHDSLGKFESYKGDRESLAIALLLYNWSLLSSEDDWVSNDGYGYLGRFGKYLLAIDDRGFVTYDEFANEDAAEREFSQLYDSGYGACEDDYYIECGRNGSYQLWLSGKQINVYPARHTDYVSYNRVKAMARLMSLRDGYYPNLWHIDERGSMTREDY